ncbi:MAG: hypothetical protein AAFY25_13670 [Pseudomonadota bacterium]
MLAGISADHGSLEVGRAADVLLLSEDLEIEGVYIGGEEFIS